MSKLAIALLSVIQRAPIAFADLWEAVDASYTFDDMQSALAELIESREIDQIPDTFAFRVAEKAA